MTFPSAGTVNNVQSGLLVTAPVAAAWVSLEGPSGTAAPSFSSYPASLKHGADAANWPDPLLINQYNTALVFSGVTYRI